MRVEVTIVYDVPDDLRHGELNLLQQKLAEQRGPADIYLAAGAERGRLVAPRVHSVTTPKVAE